MSFRSRLTLLGAAAVAVAVLVGALAIYVAVEQQLVGQVDANLTQLANDVEVQRVSGGRVYGHLPAPFLGAPGGYNQLVDADGNAYLPPDTGTVTLPISQRDREVAAGRSPAYFTEARVQGVHVRMLTKPVGSGLAVQIARPLDEVDRILGNLRVILAFMVIGGIALAVGLGLALARSAVEPVQRLAAAVEHVAATGDMTERVEVAGRHDELGRLAVNFNAMLAALDQSLRSQRQLVADASHELRTPLASLRTNIEVLERARRLPGPERDRLLSDLVSQIEQLTMLVQDLIDLARGDQPLEMVDGVRLDLVVAAAVERAGTHWPNVDFRLSSEPSFVRCDPGRIDRAVGNLLDNAGKWSPPGGPVEVSVTGSMVRVRDHGPGIAPEDLARVFDRFWRAPSARAMPGSGLGLAIVRQVAESHGGSVSAAAAEDGGTVMVLRLAPG